MVKFGIKTFGCKVNQYNSELLRENLVSTDLYCHTTSLWDVLFINACVVTGKAEKDIVRFCKKIKKTGSKVIVFGCISPTLQTDLQTLDISFFPSLEHLWDALKSKDTESTIFVDKIQNFQDRTRAFVKIQSGCNQFCSYCIVPYVRGSMENRSRDAIFSEIDQLIHSGYKEIVLTGTQIGLYHEDSKENDSLLNLLENLEKKYAKTLYRIRISSIGPTFVTPEMISFFGRSNLFCNHMHISLQSGSNKILRHMNRKYDAEYFVNLANQFKEAKENFCLSTDIIVGFPGETEEDFQDTLDICKKVQFSKIHVFPFSPRIGTRAYQFKDMVMPDVIKKRTSQLLELSKILSYNVKQFFIGKQVEVLLEEDSSGFTTNYLRVVLQNGRNRKGHLTSVLIKECDEEALYA